MLGVIPLKLVHILKNNYWENRFLNKTDFLNKNNLFLFYTDFCIFSTNFKGY